MQTVYETWFLNSRPDTTIYRVANATSSNPMWGVIVLEVLWIQYGGAIKYPVPDLKSPIIYYVIIVSSKYIVLCPFNDSHGLLIVVGY
ncbi:hypothetical protein INT45_005144 [Circinella minor]|uniref:Uncharacterized protein n=1 Tax=Circinella minor TaxID=1195481 RepID=A0A8H7RSW8_9FUNG|nr:hypothetical protein INT45_005144 [Circinella minor]